VAGSWKGEGAPEQVRLRNRALSGSGSEVKGGHIIDPKTGRQAGGHLAAWASHVEAAVADALSTAFVVMSTAEVEAFCAAFPDVWGLVVQGDGTCFEFNSLE
jgi:thiamine biosynthesis lipoprotein